MRKGSTPLGSLGVVSTGIALLILPLHAAMVRTMLTASPAWAAENGPAAEALSQRNALARRAEWLRGMRAPRPASKTARPVKVIRTHATWYGPGFHGRRTASGERFNRHALTLASRHLPLGTRVRVINVKTGKSAVARVNDRGPFGHRGVTADLSQALARKIGLGGSGPVRLEVLPAGAAGS